MLIKIVTVKGLGNKHSHCLRLVSIDYEYGYKYAMLPNNGNVKLHTCVQSFMITHAQCFMLIVKYKIMYVVIA